jgi:hypothetical protein
MIMKCKKCGNDDWYVKGRYRRCTPCHNEVQLAAYHNRKLGVSKVRKSKHTSRPLAQRINIAPLPRSQMVACSKGHEFTQENTRLEVDNKGRVHRRCLRCEYLQGRKRYGLETPSKLRKLLQEKDNPWDEIQ